MTKRMLYLFRGDGGSGRPSFADRMEQAGWTVDGMMISHHARLRGLPEVLFSRRRIADYDLVAAGEYNLVWALCLRLFGTKRPTLVALGFNQSSRLIKTGVGPADWLLDRLWRRVSRFLIASRDEARLFAREHHIPADRFIFSHWGYDLPAHDPAKTPLPDAPFVSMIGRNNRDCATFCTAVEKAGVHGVIVTSRVLADALGPVPPSVTLLVDRSMEDCLNYTAGSFAHLILVTDGERGAGHISAVSAMLLGKPQIFSRVAPLADYLIDGENGIAVPLQDADAVAAAIVRLRDDPALAARLGGAGKAFATANMTNDVSLKRLVDFLLTDA